MKLERTGLNYFRHALPSSRLGMDLETRIENGERFDYLVRRGRSIIDRGDQGSSQNSAVNTEK